MNDELCGYCFGMLVGGCEGTDKAECKYFTYEDGTINDGGNVEVTKISVSKGVTVSVGKYESIRIDSSMEIGLGKNDDSETVTKTGYEMLDEQINDQLKEIQDLVGDNSVFKFEEPKKKSGSRRRT